MSGSSFNVFVTRDDRLPSRDYQMGLEPLFETQTVSVRFRENTEREVITPEAIDGAQAVVLLKASVPASTLQEAQNLKLIARFGAGFDSVDIEAATEAGVTVTNAPQGMRDSVAQATVGMLIVCASHMRRYDRIVRDVGFDGRLPNMGVELFNKRLGMIGLGQIGRRTVELLSPFDMEIIAYDPYLSEREAEDLGVTLVSLQQLLQSSDFVSIHCPLTEETHHMLDQGSFRSMKEEAYLVNTTRGGIYPDQALADAIQEGEIAGAAIDVFENEPKIENNPLLDLEDVLVMPHAAGINRDGLTETGNIVSESVLATKRGNIPRNVLNPSVFDQPVPEAKLSPSFRGHRTKPRG